MLVDRGLAGYPLLAQLVHADKDIVARCSTGSFGAAQELFGLNQDGVRRRARLSATSDQRASLRANLESVLSAPAAQVWAEHREECQFARQVNRADAFHALKTHVVELLCGNTPAEGVVRQLQRWFLRNPVSVRDPPNTPRLKPSACRSHHFRRHVKKIVF